MTTNIGYIQTGKGENVGFLRIRYIGGIPHYDFTKDKSAATQLLRRHWEELKHIFPRDKFVA